MHHTMMIHITRAVHALVMDEEIVSLHYSIYSGSHLKTILKLGRKTNYQTYGKNKINYNIINIKFCINRLTPLEYIGNCISPSHPDMEQLLLLYWIK